MILIEPIKRRKTSFVLLCTSRLLHLSAIECSQSLNSSAWKQRHVNDEYVKRARYENFRARSAYKLLEINAKHDLIRPGQVIIDLGASPGSWTQVATRLMGLNREYLANKPKRCQFIDTFNRFNRRMIRRLSRLMNTALKWFNFFCSFFFNQSTGKSSPKWIRCGHRFVAHRTDRRSHHIGQRWLYQSSQSSQGATRSGQPSRWSGHVGHGTERIRHSAIRPRPNIGIESIGASICYTSVEAHDGQLFGQNVGRQSNFSSW